MSPQTTSVPASTIVAAPTTAAATTTTVEATTTTAPPSAGDVYLTLVTPLNCASQFVDLVEADVYGADGYVYENEWSKMQEKLQPAYRSLADAQVTWIEGLVAYAWPAEVSADVEALVAETSTDASFYESLAFASTYDEFNAVEYSGETGAATVVRAKLGLPSNVNSEVNFCEGVVAG